MSLVTPLRLSLVDVLAGSLNKLWFVDESLIDETVFANQAELDAFLVSNGITSGDWQTIVTALGYTNQNDLDLAIQSGALTGEIILVNA